MQVVPSDYGAVLEQITSALRTRFNRLRHERDWRLLFNHLLQQTGWIASKEITSDAFLEQVFGGELVNGTVLLFQSLCKIRFGYLDGQARIMALYHFSRKVYPGLNNLFPLSQLTQNIDELKKSWSLRKTGEEAICTIVHGPTQVTTGIVSQECVLKLNALSKDLLEHLIHSSRYLKYVKLSSLSDCIRRLKSVPIDWKYTNFPDEEAPIRKLMDLSQNMKAIFMSVLKVLVSYDTDLAENLLDARLLKEQKELSEEEFLEYVYGQRLPTVSKQLLFPALQSRRPGVSIELIGLLALLGCAKADTTSMLHLESCMNKQWIIPVVDSSQVGGVAISDLHVGTFVNESIPEAWFHAQLYAVSFVCVHLRCQGD